MSYEAPVRVSGATADAPHDDDLDFELIGYCGRPSCRNAFTQTSGRGRRREFCSEMCRRGADKDYKRAKAIVTSLEELLERSRHDVAAFGRVGDEGSVRTPEMEIQITKRASAAVQRAQGLLEFASAGDERLLKELRDLVDAVAPLVRVS